MPLTKHTESKLKKFKKEELISHIITLYDKISEGEAGSVPYYEHKELIEKYDKLTAELHKVLKERQEDKEEDVEFLNEQLEKKEEIFQKITSAIAENDTLKQKLKDFQENTEHIWKQQKCAEDELKKVEELMSIFTDNGELPGGEMGCLGS